MTTQKTEAKTLEDLRPDDFAGKLWLRKVAKRADVPEGASPGDVGDPIAWDEPIPVERSHAPTLLLTGDWRLVQPPAIYVESEPVLPQVEDPETGYLVDDPKADPKSYRGRVRCVSATDLGRAMSEGFRFIGFKDKLDKSRAETEVKNRKAARAAAKSARDKKAASSASAPSSTAKPKEA